MTRFLYTTFLKESLDILRLLLLLLQKNLKGKAKRPVDNNRFQRTKILLTTNRNNVVLQKIPHSPVFKLHWD